MQTIVAMRTESGWLFRGMEDGQSFTVNGTVHKVDAKRTVEPELDRAYGRRGWVYFN